MGPRNHRTSTSSSALIACLAGLILLTAHVSAQTPTPYHSVGPQTVITNGETLLSNESAHAALPPGPGGSSQPPYSPSTATNFQGLTDNNDSFPPDTCGAVGTNHVVTMLNTQVRIATRGGATITTMTLSNFWVSTNIGSFSVIFDPRIEYDPYNDPWIACASVDYFSSSSAILIGVSRTSSPTNTGDAGWNLRRVKADSGNTLWADFPMMGFNKKWIVVSANMFDNTGGIFNRGNHYVFNKTNLYGGGFTSPTLLTDTNVGTSFSEFPAVTYDNSLSTLYLMQNLNGNFQGFGYMRLLSITGNIGSEVLNNAGANPIHIRVPSPWEDQEPASGADFAA
jgi:hypothetical protein